MPRPCGKTPEGDYIGSRARASCGGTAGNDDEGRALRRLLKEHRVDARRLRGHDPNRPAAEAVAEQEQRDEEDYFQQPFHAVIG